MRKIKKVCILAGLLLFALAVNAQLDTDKVDMADAMRSNGRIYVVVAVVVVILIGLIMYLVRIDKKISKIENEKH